MVGGHVKAIGHRLGRRGAALLFFSLLDLIYGFSLTNPSPSTATRPDFKFVAGIMALPYWGMLWLAVGVLLLIGAFLREDSLAWAAAMLIKVLWGLVFLLGWLIAGLERGYVSAAIWLSTAALVALLASWPEPGDGGRKMPVWMRATSPR